ncbi:DUF262 domain-containing protein [Streptomyces aidingensis]|uniref:GmrSD restriction endonucleases N-terminal domain-containing protein n=1 Tax=Streptomyces aidingensis TaxID=910347 RepID=A0A1I1TKB7_9ACTN|nr:DUF262 domain-containing protein [Streptomyces aidingensis]SFD59072.1 Protein of unknown function DUF262 [Streptomyces aidingensis]
MAETEPPSSPAAPSPASPSRATAHAAAELRVEIDDSGRSAGVEPEEENGGVQEPFDPERIEVQTRNPTVSLLLNRLERGTIDLTPDFQRAAGIWKPVVQSRLIESLLLRITLPAIYAAEEGDDSWVVVDGVQRLSTIARFVKPELLGEPPLRLSGLEYLTQFNGCTFHDLPGRMKTRIEETELIVLLIRHGTPEAVKFNIFARINTAGAPLSRQELRHALIPGRARDFLKELASSPAFLDATGHSVSPARMADREMCLRFVAFLLTPPNQYTGQDFDGFLRNAMHRINGLSDPELGRVRGYFRKGMAAGRLVFGEWAFRKLLDSDRRPPINKALFEAEAVNLALLSREEIEELDRRDDMLFAEFEALMDDTIFYDAISAGTGDADKVNYRFQSVKDAFWTVLNA